MANYKARLREDLDRWIADGLVPEASRLAILDRVPEPRRLDASQALAAVGGLLLGVAVIAFVAANWNVIPRLPRFGLVLTLFLATCAAGAWAGERRPLTRNILLLVASLVFAAAIGLTGQIFDITGDPVAALRGAGLAAFLLALAGRSSGAAVAGLFFLAIGDASLFGAERSAPWLALAAPAGLVLARRWRSKPLAHAGGLAVPMALCLMLVYLHLDWGDCLAIAVVMAAVAGFARSRREKDGSFSEILYGWSVWAALVFYVLAGLGDWEGAGLLHRTFWLIMSVGVAALGVQDRRSAITSAGVLGIAGAIGAILLDLGIGLLTAAFVFGAVALAMLAPAFLLALRRTPRA